MGEPDADQISVVESILGVFGINKDSELVEKVLYPKDPKKIAAALSRLNRGELTKEVVEIVERLLQRGFKSFVFTNKALAEAVGGRWGVEFEVGTGEAAGAYLRDNLEELAVDFGMVEDVSQFHSLSHEVSLLIARSAIGRALSEREAIISQTVHVLGELDKALNVLSSKLREWYGLHFPEFSRLVDDHRTYAKIVSKIGNRDGFGVKGLMDLGLPRIKAEEISRAAQASMGATTGQEDLAPVKLLASYLLDLYRYRGLLEEYLSALAEEIAPNLSEVAGQLLAAKLMEKAGGLRKLAMMPSSTLQLLGAEKAMFRALKSGSKPPKHGIIFQHPLVHASPRRIRGRSARALAAKLSIAARADAFSGKSLGEQLRRELDSRMERNWNVE